MVDSELIIRVAQLEQAIAKAQTLTLGREVSSMGAQFGIQTTNKSTLIAHLQGLLIPLKEELENQRQFTEQKANIPDQTQAQTPQNNTLRNTLLLGGALLLLV